MIILFFIIIIIFFLKKKKKIISLETTISQLENLLKENEGN